MAWTVNEPWAAILVALLTEHTDRIQLAFFPQDLLGSKASGQCLHENGLHRVGAFLNRSGLRNLAVNGGPQENTTLL